MAIDVGLLSATLIAVETTLYAVSVALYSFLMQRARLSVTDRLLLSLLEKKDQMADVASGITDKVFGTWLLVLGTANYVFGLFAGLIGWVQDEPTWPLAGLGAFLGGYIAFLITLEWSIPRQVRKLVEIGEKFLAGRQP